VSDAFVRRLSTAVVVVCLLALAGTVALVVSPSLRARAGVGPASEAPPYAEGDRVDIDAAAYSTSPLSLILFARSTCPACQRSSDFYRQVIAAGQAHKVPAVLVTPSTDTDAERVYAEGLGIPAAKVYQALPGSIKLRAVPALMVVDSSGLIRHVWFGAPEAATQTTIMAAVTALAGSRVP
jgi:peroxiredoxin